MKVRKNVRWNPFPLQPHVLASWGLTNGSLSNFWHALTWGQANRIHIHYLDPPESWDKPIRSRFFVSQAVNHSTCSNVQCLASQWVQAGDTYFHFSLLMVPMLCKYSCAGSIIAYIYIRIYIAFIKCRVFIVLNKSWITWNTSNFLNKIFLNSHASNDLKY